MSNEPNDLAIEGWDIDGAALVKDVSSDHVDTDILADNLRAAAHEKGQTIDLTIKPRGIEIRLPDQSDGNFAIELDNLIESSTTGRADQ